MLEKNWPKNWHIMNEKRHHILLSGYIDGELSPEEKLEFEEYMATNPDLQKELKAFNKLREVTGAMKYADIPEAVWEGYWAGLYRRMERGIGWILVSISAILFLIFGCYYLTCDFFLDPEPSIFMKIAVGAGFVGFIILLVSVIRERIFACRRDRYDEVKR